MKYLKKTTIDTYQAKVSNIHIRNVSFQLNIQKNLTSHNNVDHQAGMAENRVLNVDFLSRISKVNLFSCLGEKLIYVNFYTMLY